MIEYREENPEPREYLDLFETTGWNKKYKATAADLRNALRGSWHSISAYDGDRLVGFGRVVSDGILYAMVYDMIVLPSHRHRGIGTEILQRLITKCNDAGIREIQLFSAAGKTPFYLKRGFVERPREAPGMRFNR
jgi:GNAT superfamily N-acetyltransferase